MPNKLNGNLKWIVALASLILIIAGIVAAHYDSLTAIKEKVDTCVNTKIDDNDRLDSIKFFPKEAGNAIKAEVLNNKEDITEIKESIINIELYQQENRQLLIEIKTIVNQVKNGG